MKRVLAYTATRAEYGLLRPILRRITESNELDLELVVGGDHLSSRKGRTLGEIERDGFPVSRVIDCVPESTGPSSIGRSVGEATAQVSEVFSELRPDVLLLLGDRHDLLPPACAALLHRVPIAHIGGGESTQGALDEQIRHALSKMAHLHFVSAPHYGRTLRLMGEEEWRIHVVGSLGVENIRNAEVISPKEIMRTYCVDVSAPFALVTYHPQTVGRSEPARDMSEVLRALSRYPEVLQIITYPGLEVGSDDIVGILQRHESEAGCRVRLFPSLGSRGYLGLMKYARAIVGNSSSGIIEAPSLHIPTVNIGDRQKGRLRSGSVIDVECDSESIAGGMYRALYDDDFRQRCAEVSNPYDPFCDANSSGRIVSVLEQIPLGRSLLEKRLDFGDRGGENGG